jgi:hypothetical protein
MTAPVKHSMDKLAQWYGLGPHWICEFTMLGGGSGLTYSLAAPPSTPPAVATTPAGIPTLMVTPTYVSTGNNTLTFDDCYWALVGASATVDDINGTTPVLAFMGQPTNLGAGLTGAGTNFVITITTYTISTTPGAADVALNTPVRVRLTFKKSPTGAVQ